MRPDWACNSYVQQALILALEDNCPLRPVKTGKYSLKWTPSPLDEQQGGSLNKSQTERTPQGWKLYREAQWRHRKEVRKALKEAWRTFWCSINDLPMSATLRRAFSRDPKIKMDLWWIL